MSTKRVTLYVPPGHTVRSATPRSWDIIFETLAMDSRSSGFDPALREEIAAALAGLGLPCAKKLGGLVPVTVSVPRGHRVRVAADEHWGTVDETLDMDRQSPSFDPSLRRDISRAYCNMNACAVKLVGGVA